MKARKAAKRKKLIQATLSLWILFHLTVVLVVPAGQSAVGTCLASFVAPYAQFFEMTNAWSFFAPHPGPPPVFMEYELSDADGKSIRKGSWPELEDPFYLRERQNRRMASAEFMASSPLRIQNLVVPYLCHANADAVSVRVWVTTYRIPAMGDIAKGASALRDESTVNRTLGTTGFCREFREGGEG